MKILTSSKLHVAVAWAVLAVMGIVVWAQSARTPVELSGPVYDVLNEMRGGTVVNGILEDATRQTTIDDIQAIVHARWVAPARAAAASAAVLAVSRQIEIDSAPVVRERRAVDSGAISGEERTR